MTRMSRLFATAILASLPVAAFAQPLATPEQGATPTGMTTTAPNLDRTTQSGMPADKTLEDKTTAGTTKIYPSANAMQPLKPTVKTAGDGAKSAVHGKSPVAGHHARMTVPAKSAEPAKS